MKRIGITGLLILVSLAGFTQDTLIKKLDSLSEKADTARQENIIEPEAYNKATKLSFRTYFVLLGSNLKQQVTGPFNASKKSWIKAGQFALVTGALFFADESIQKQAVKLRNNSGIVRNVSGFVTDFGGLYEGYTLASLAAYGFLFKDEKIQTTTLLATQAYITGASVMTIVKYLTGRQRPSYYGTDTIEAEPIFHGPFSPKGRSYNGKHISSSFPSGHSTVAFAAATVFAMEYKDKPWVPVLAYSAASLISLSRITENKHWATDVLVGAGLGYLSGRQVVNNYHRYAKLKAPNQKSSLRFNLNLFQGHILPGFVYTF